MNFTGTCGCGSSFAVYHGEATGKAAAVLRLSEWLARHAHCRKEMTLTGKATAADALYPCHTEGGE